MSNPILWNTKENRPLAKGDKVPGGRLSHKYANVDSLTDETLGLCYNGECRTIPFALPMDSRMAQGLGIELR